MRILIAGRRAQRNKTKMENSTRRGSFRTQHRYGMGSFHDFSPNTNDMVGFIVPACDIEHSLQGSN